MNESFLPLVLKHLACKLVSDLRARINHGITDASTLLHHNVQLPVEQFTGAVKDTMARYEKYLENSERIL